MTPKYTRYQCLLNVLNSLQVSDVTKKAATDFPMEADDSVFTDFDVMSKDVEKATKL